EPRIGGVAVVALRAVTRCHYLLNAGAFPRCAAITCSALRQRNAATGDAAWHWSDCMKRRASPGGIGRHCIDGDTGRKRRFFVLPPGGNPDAPADWKTTRELRRNGTRLTFAQARADGWQIATREAKHVYAVHVGRDRRRWRATIATLPYP